MPEFEEGESVHADDMVFAESIGLAVANDEDQEADPLFGIALRTPGGGTVMMQMNAVEMVAIIADAAALVAKVMSGQNADG